MSDFLICPHLTFGVDLRAMRTNELAATIYLHSFIHSIFLISLIIYPFLYSSLYSFIKL